MTSKVECTKCGVPKVLDDYYRRTTNSNGIRQPCKECTAKIGRQSRNKPDKKERKRQVSRDYYRKPGVKERILRKSKHRRRVDHLKYKFGLSPVDVADMTDAQCGFCGICQQPFEKTPHIDHDHTTGKVRGLLCSNCNAGLGQFKDDPVRLQSAIEYLLIHSA